MIITGDCVAVMAGMEPDSIDAVVTDPPYGLEFMGKEWDRLDGAGFHAPKDEGRTFTNASGHMYDNLKSLPRYGSVPAMQAWHQAWAAAALRVAKPGAYLLAFGGTRTAHRLTVALEDAGWIIRDVLCWVYASGFPKSKASLKPAWEPIVLARKPGPLRPLAIDDCRIGWQGDGDRAEAEGKNRHQSYANPGSNRDSYSGHMPERSDYSEPTGRWPANVVLTSPAFDGGWDGVVGGGTAVGAVSNGRRQNGALFDVGEQAQMPTYGDTGTYSRFFLVPKASRADREPDVPGELEERAIRTLEGGPVVSADHPGTAYGGRATRRNTHPTVKPTALMRHLVRLVTPRGGTVLDPFLGSGSTAKAAILEGFDWVGIEQDASYVAIAEQRLVGLRPEPEQMELAV